MCKNLFQILAGKFWEGEIHLQVLLLVGTWAGGSRRKEGKKIQCCCIEVAESE